MCYTANRSVRTAFFYPTTGCAVNRNVGIEMKITQGDEVECSHTKHLVNETVLARQGVHHVYNKVEFGVLLKSGEESSLLNC